LYCNLLIARCKYCDYNLKLLILRHTFGQQSPGHLCKTTRGLYNRGLSTTVMCKILCNIQENRNDDEINRNDFKYRRIIEALSDEGYHTAELEVSFVHSSCLFFFYKYQTSKYTNSLSFIHANVFKILNMIVY